MLAKTYSMTADPQSLYDRLMAIKPDGLSANAWTVRAGLNRNVLSDIRRRGTANHETIEKLLGAISVTFAEFEAGQRQEQKEPAADRRAYLAFRGDDRPRNVPVAGTALCADLVFPVDGHTVEIEAMELDLNEVVDYARRPLTLDNKRDVYALYFRGLSMSPRYEPGEIAYVDPSRPPSIGDYVVVQLREADGMDGERIHTVVAKRLIRQTVNFLELEQFNPATTFRVERTRVARLHRIIPWDELVSF